MNKLENRKIIDLLIKLSNKAYQKGEIPVSAIVIYKNKIIAKAYNQKERKKNIIAHAEILSIQRAAKKLNNWNLSDCSLYVTLEPCNMCMEVIRQSRIQNVFYLLDKLNYKHDFSKTSLKKLDYEKSIKTYQQLLSDFFQNMR